MKKLVSLIVGLALCLGLTSFAFAEGPAPVASEQLDAIETALYGTHQSSSMMERMESLEDDIYGAPDSGRNILDHICGTNGGNGSFLQKLNGADARLNARVTAGPAKTRIEELENTLFGQIQGGTLNQRLERLVATTYNGGKVPVEAVVLPKDSLVKIEFTAPLSSKTAQPGDPVKFRVADNLYVNDVLVLSKGADGVGEVSKVVQPRSFGRDARIDVKFSHVFAVDGSKVPIYIGKLAQQEAKTAIGAAGATIGGMVVLGPIGAVGGAFVTGKSKTIEAGSTTYVQVVEDQKISGIVYQETTAAGAQS